MLKRELKRLQPRICRADGRWMCWSPAIFGSRIVGWGWTPTDAYVQWVEKANG